MTTNSSLALPRLCSPLGRKRSLPRARRTKLRRSSATCDATTYSPTPLHSVTSERLTSGEKVSPPRWDAFCNSHAGVWVGRVGTYGPGGSSCETAGVQLVQECGCARIVTVQDGVFHEALQEVPRSGDAPEEPTLTKSVDAGLVYFEDGTFTRGPVHLSEFVAGKQQQAVSKSCETVSFEFGIVAPGGCYCTRVTQKVRFQTAPGSTTAQNESSEPMVTLGGATVSVEEWSGPSRVHTEEKSLRELEKMEQLCLRLPQPADDFVGEWRSFNRIATPVGQNPEEKKEEEEEEEEDDDDDDENEASADSDETRPKFVFEGEKIVQNVTLHRDGGAAPRSQCLFLHGDVAICLSHGSSEECDTLTISAGWTYEKGISSKFVEREYSKKTGELLHIRDCSKVLGRWVGGEM